MSGSGISYTVWYSTSNGSTEIPPSGANSVSGITGTTTTLTGLSSSTSYYVWVAALSSDGRGTYSTRSSVSTLARKINCISVLESVDFEINLKCIHPSLRYSNRLLYIH